MTGTRITDFSPPPVEPVVACHEAAEEQTRERFEKLKPRPARAKKARKKRGRR